MALSRIGVLINTISGFATGTTKISIHPYVFGTLVLASPIQDENCSNLHEYYGYGKDATNAPEILALSK